jgi:hypothetical protein
VELTQRRDGMWQLHGRLSNTVGAQLNAIMDPLTTPRSTAIEDDDGTIIHIPDERPQAQRLHDALEEACARLLKSGDQPSVGGVPASVIVTISLQELLAKAGLGETADGTQLTAQQLLQIADEAEIWAHHHQPPRHPNRARQNTTISITRPNHGINRPRGRMLLPRLHPPGELLRPAPHPGLDTRRPHRS